MKVRNAHVYGVHTHAKDIYVKGLVNGRQLSVVVTGSQNFTSQGLYVGDEDVAIMKSDAVFRQHRALFYGQWIPNTVPATSKAKMDARTTQTDIPTSGDPKLVEE